ncbi:MAG TPA: HEAT repeat domain-containing protein [Bryobacteraceae bacterium]|nr:HEAT repeat domain-containing protein [Bryobacteraceae bacterium]
MIFSAARILPVLLAGLTTCLSVAQPAPVWRRLLPPGTHSVPASDAKRTYSVLLSVPIPSQQSAPGKARLLAGDRVLAEKTLHTGDPDLYTLVRGAGVVRLELAVPAAVQVVDLGAAPQLEAEPNNTWQTANPLELGKTVWASGDEAPYIPAELSTKIEANPHEDWFRFSWSGSKPQLVYFSLDVLDRDNIPVDVSVHRESGGQLKEYSEGEDPVTIPHEVQALPGNKFTTRLLREPGNYYIRVKLTHPFYRLQTRVMEAPPYADPRKAVQTAVDYLVGAGDSWHANTPRRGGLFNRVASNHQETTLCVACHATHFTQRAQLYALRKGYPVHYPDQLSFLAERFYNNPRPFYGFEAEGAVWSRVISASANVLGRMSHLLQIYENELTHDPRPAYHNGVGGYLSLYYKNRTKLPGDETNGNTPLVSTYEVAWYAWESSKDASIAALLAQDHEIKNVIDLCYQTLALAAVDRKQYADKIAKNAERILQLQRPDGQWSARFDESSHPVEFQTGHALWALHAAGIPRENPQVAKGLAFLLRRQQPFGGWLDPLQSYENFRTPFRETQMAVLALSAYYPAEAGEARWGTNPAGPIDTLEALNGVWSTPEPARLREIEALTTVPEPMYRAQALETLGRLGRSESLPVIAARMDDPSKLVQRAAAWAMRQVYNRRPEAASPTLSSLLQSQDERARWSATRVFATHFAALAKRDEFAPLLARRMSDSNPAIAIQAIKAAWQYWYWTPSLASREILEDAVLAAMAKPQHAWVERNLKEAVYNIADENIRYLYNNWVPGLARPEDRERVIRGRLAIEDRLANKFAKVLEGSDKQQIRWLLAGLSEFELRRGDVYDPSADRTTVFPGVYNRIGNDVEQIVFFGASNDRVAKALAPHLQSSDPEVRRLALLAGQMLRDAAFGEVSKAAGPPQGARDPILAAVKAAQPAPAVRSGGSGGSRARPGTAKPDDDYFRGYVEPVLTTRGKDGQACVHCHASHTLFNATLTTAKNVINLDDPESSLILVKPTSSAESEGVVNASKTAHGGGVRFEKGSPEYNTILNWIRGTKP